MSTYAAYGGVSINPQMMKLRKGVDVLVATPGRLLDLYRQKAIKFSQLQTLILDEADRMLDLGFAEELRGIYAVLPKQRQTLLFSATFSDEIRLLAAQMLNDPLTIEVSPRNVAASSVKQWVVTVDKKRKADLFIHLMKKHRWGQVLVFAKTRVGVDQLVDRLQGLGLNADGIHGDKPQATRQRALDRFKSNEVKILVATDVAARVWISTTCRPWSTWTCRSWPRITFTVLVAPVVRARPVRLFRWCVPMRWNCCRPLKC